MELFYAYKVGGGYAYLDSEESYHCVRVLRHIAGEPLNIIDGHGTFLHCTLKDASLSAAVATIVSEEPGWGGHPYYLRMAVCPTKNMDRYEWFVEKATELGVDEIVPVIGEHSERRKVREDRLQKIALSAAKQSLKGAVPVIAPAVSVANFVGSLPGMRSAPQKKCSAERSCQPAEELRLIAYCSDDVATRGSIVDALLAAEAVESHADGECRYRTPFSGVRTCPFPAAEGSAAASSDKPIITVLIGPEGDFSQGEVQAAIRAGFEPVHLGPSRLRTETAAITAVEAVYLTLGLNTPAYDSETAGRISKSAVPGK